MKRSASTSSFIPTAMRTMGRHSILTFCVMAMAVVAAGGASAQDRSAAGAISSLPCRQLSLEALPMQNFTPGSRPFGIPLAAWSPDAFDALTRRVDVCYTGRDRSDASRAKSQITYFRQSAAPYIAQIDRKADRAEALKQSMLDNLNAVRGEASAAAASERLDQVRKRLEVTSLPPDVRGELVAAFDDVAADLESQQRDAAEAQARDEKVKAAEADARARRQAADQARADAERTRQAADQAAANVEDRKRNHAARLQAEADAKARVDSALKDAEASRKEAADAESARLEVVKREQAARSENQKLEAEERAAAEARQRSERQLQNQRSSKGEQSGGFITPRSSAVPNVGSNTPAPQAGGAASPADDLGSELAMISGAESVFRVCVEDFGEYASEYESVKQEAARVGQLAVDQKVLTVEKLAKFRDEAGLTTGRGLLMLLARKHVNPLGACEETATLMKLAPD